MRKITFVSMAVVLALLLSASLSVTMAQGASPDGTHLLLQPGDVSTFGNTYVLIPDGSIEAKSSSGPGVLAGWIEGRTTSFGVGSETTKEYALIDSYSYKFTSSQQAQAALRAVQFPKLADGVSQLDPTLIQLLKRQSNAWQVWYGVDSEGLPAYAVMIQSGSYVTKVYVNVGPNQESFGQRLFNYIAKRVYGGTIGATTSTEVITDQASVLPNWWASGVRASYWLSQVTPDGETHYLATWPWPHGNNPHYLGYGGDAATCVPTHGCINQWTWWLTSPESRPGVPKFFLITNWPPGNTISNYSATVWMD
jgi:hypothetical protein